MNRYLSICNVIFLVFMNLASPVIMASEQRGRKLKISRFYDSAECINCSPIVKKAILDAKIRTKLNLTSKNTCQCHQLTEIIKMLNYQRCLQELSNQ